jgi:3-oxosteroid 1-dehydrogenase
MDGEFDVVVVGSGAAGLMSALRAADRGLSVAVIEKTQRYGGTSAISGGGLWIPNHGRGGIEDSRKDALTYLSHVCKGEFRQDRVEAFVDGGPPMVQFLEQAGMTLQIFPCPDYFVPLPGSSYGRFLMPAEVDGADLGEAIHALRDPPFAFKLLNRYSLDLAQASTLSSRPRGWQWTAAKIFGGYWLDLPWRRKTPRDRRLTMGNALIGGLLKALRGRDVPIFLNTGLSRLLVENDRVAGIEARRDGKPVVLHARHGVVLAAGGFEQNQAMREQYLPVPSDARWSLTPKGGNTGDAVRAGQAIGAATESMGCNWWAPSTQLPSREDPNLEVTHQMFFDHRHPYSLCVNKLGRRFINESCSYDVFGKTMIEDQRKTGANLPCWMIFDATYRQRYSAGGLMPLAAMSDRDAPPNWWDTYIYRTQTIAELARKIEIDAATLAETVARLNSYARAGEDPEFGRGSGPYDRFFGDPAIQPNPCLGPVETAPFYAIRIDLGDLGSKGGLKADTKARVMKEDGGVIEGLYAVGNSSGAPFGDCYPGAGGTLGPAMVFAFVAANDIAERARPRSNGMLTAYIHRPLEWR